MKQVKNNLNIEFLLNLLKQGKSPSTISKELNISKQSINYYLKTLKDNGNIIKKGYGVWEVKDSTLRIEKSKSIRGHAFIWKIKLNKPLNLSNLNYKLVRNKIPRLIINDKKVWIGKKHIIVYESKSFYAKDSINSRKYAVISLIECLEALGKQINTNLKPYIFKPVKEHYSMIKNELAKQYNRNNEKMIIRDDIEGEWLWIDDSDSLNELETKNLVRSKQVQDWWNDNKKHDFKVTPSFLMESINKIVVNQQIFDKNMSSHLEVLNKISNAIDDLNKTIKQLNIKENKGRNKNILDFE